MVQNECHLCQLQECLHRLRVHQSFHQLVHGRHGNLNSAGDALADADPRRVLQMLPVQLSEEEHAAYVSRLREWVKSLWTARAFTPPSTLGRARAAKEPVDVAPAQSTKILSEAATTAEMVEGWGPSLRDSSITKATLANKKAVMSDAGARKALTSDAVLANVSSTESWDEAYAEALKQQQMLLANVNGELELAVEKLSRERRERMQSDPQGTLGELRDSVDASERERKGEEERLLSQYRATLDNLHDAHDKEFGDLEAQYEQELSALREKLLKLSGSEAYVEAVSHKIRRESAMGTPGRRSRARDLGTPEKMPRAQSPFRQPPVPADEQRTPKKGTEGTPSKLPVRRTASACRTPEEEVRKNFRSRRVGRALQNRRRAKSAQPGRPPERSWAAAGPEPHPPDRRELKSMYDQVVGERDVLQDQVKMLIADIEKRVETEKRLHTVNVELRARLEGLHQEVEGDAHINAQAAEIRRLNQALEVVQEKAAGDAALLKQMMDERLKEDMADGFAENWRNRRRNPMQYAITSWQQQSVAAAWRKWKEAYDRFRFRRHYLARLVFQHHNYCFQQWAKLVRSAKLSPEVESALVSLGMKHCDGSRIARSFGKWKDWLHNRHMILSVIGVDNARVLKSTMRMWRNYRAQKGEQRKLDQLTVAKQWARRANYWVLKCFAKWTRYPIDNIRARATSSESEKEEYVKRHSISQMEQEVLLKKLTSVDNTLSAVRVELYERECAIQKLEKLLHQKSLVETSLRTEISKRDLSVAEHRQEAAQPEIPGAQRDAQWLSQQELELRSAQAQVERLKTELLYSQQEKDSKLSSAFSIAATLRGLLHETVKADPNALVLDEAGNARKRDEIDDRLEALVARAAGGSETTVVLQERSNQIPSSPSRRRRRASNKAQTPSRKKPEQPRKVLDLAERRKVASAMASADIQAVHTDVLSKDERRRAAAALAEVRLENNLGGPADEWSQHHSAFSKLQEKLDNLTKNQAAPSADGAIPFCCRHDVLSLMFCGAESDAASGASGESSASAVLPASNDSDSGNSSSFMQQAALERILASNTVRAQPGAMIEKAAA